MDPNNPSTFKAGDGMGMIRETSQESESIIARTNTMLKTGGNEGELETSPMQPSSTC
jgi:hypothetical protein